MEFTGRLKTKGDIKPITDKFTKREFVLKDEGKYPNTIQFQLVQNNCPLLDGFNIGDNLKVKFNLQGREWTSPKGEVKVFNTLNVFKIEKVGESNPPIEDMPQDSTLPF